MLTNFAIYCYGRCSQNTIQKVFLETFYVKNYGCDQCYIHNIKINDR